jgi:hypothetical protein
MNNKIPIFIAVTIGLSILTTSVSVNSAIAKEDWGFGGHGGMGYGGMGYGGHGEMGYGGMGYGGHGEMGYGGMAYGSAGSVVQEPVDTGNPQLDKAISKFYNCLSDAHEDPPTFQKANGCYYQTLGSNGGMQA